MLFGVRDCFIFVYNGKKFLIRDSIVLSHLTEVSKIPLQLIYIYTIEILRFPSESKTSFSPSFKKHLFHCVTSQCQLIHNQKISLASDNVMKCLIPNRSVKSM